MKIKTKDFIENWLIDKSLQEAFNNDIFEYALYTCGGDFSLFDDIQTLTNQFKIEF